MHFIYAACLTIITYAHAQDYNFWNIATRVSVGPAWHRYNSTQFFTQKIAPPYISLLPTQDIASTSYLIMPYYEGALSLLPYKNCNMHLFAATGSLKNGIGTMNISFPGMVYNHVELFYSQLPSLVHSSITLIDGSFDYTLGNKNISISPLLGYAFNAQKPIFYLYSVDTTYKYNNIWKGPYIGFKLVYKPHKTIDFEFLYKFSIAHLKMQIFVNSPPNLIKETVFISDSTHSTANGDAWGNQLQVACWYAKTFWKLGLNFKYIQYNNRKKIPVCLGETNTYGNPQSSNGPIFGSKIQNAMWQQIVLMLSLEGHF